ncbi:hypothetical protein AX768_13715 [Burkholderia sp. PAMC 28687]|uniref:hypothetical protein n=1 Tax=Burkholderia sp. PAMC 28687 TaxID=1795874 RepID=UPI000785FC62|nr:hypothetical protein [Burkholderia sp. PAMC 28687]AMM14995.1 hypothetical protein AX768_13715 [Burkholderia sp. PAMC 28687]
MLRKRIVVSVALICVLGVQLAHSQALLAPVENLVINRAEAAILTRVAISRGFAANDPRIAATLTSMGQASTALNVVSTGVAVGLGFAGAPVWLTVAAGLGILAAGSALYAGSVSLSRSMDGKTITAQQPLPQSVGATYTPVSAAPATDNNMVNPWVWAAQQGIPVYRTAQCQSGDAFCTAFPSVPTSGQKNFDYSAGTVEIIPNTIQQVQQFEGYQQQYSANGGVTNPTNPQWTYSGSSVYWQPNADGTQQTLYISVNGQQQVYDSTSGNFVWQPLSRTQALTNYTIGPGVKPATGTDLSQVYPQLQPAALTQTLDPSTLAALTNQTWQQAASQPGYQGLPYSATQPISFADVQPWVAQNPTLAPNVSDLFRPATDPGVTQVTISPTVQPGSAGVTDPASSPSTGAGNNVNVVNTPNVNVVNKVSVDLGADPGVQAPTLESAPTISMILSPLLNLFPDLKGWSVPTHGSACPEPSFTAFGRSFTLSAQCDLAESHRTGIYTAFAAMFTLAALLVVLRA